MKKLKLKSIDNEKASVDREIDSNNVIHTWIHSNRQKANDLWAQETYYWRLDDPERKNLLSIDISCDSGKITSIEMLLYNDYIYPIKRVSNGIIKEDFGVPVYDMSLWKTQNIHSSNRDSNIHKFCELSGVFKIQTNDSDLRIELFSESIAHKIIIEDNLTFEFNDKDELCAITLSEFGKGEIKALKKRYGWREA